MKCYVSQPAAGRYVIFKYYVEFMLISVEKLSN